MTTNESQIKAEPKVIKFPAKKSKREKLYSIGRTLKRGGKAFAEGVKQTGQLTANVGRKVNVGVIKTRKGVEAYEERRISRLERKAAVKERLIGAKERIQTVRERKAGLQQRRRQNPPNFLAQLQRNYTRKTGAKVRSPFESKKTYNYDPFKFGK